MYHSFLTNLVRARFHCSCPVTYSALLGAVYSCCISCQNASYDVVSDLDHSYVSEIAVFNAPSSATLNKVEML